jgi:hypothetical protein
MIHGKLTGFAATAGAVVWNMMESSLSVAAIPILIWIPVGGRGIAGSIHDGEQLRTVAPQNLVFAFLMQVFGGLRLYAHQQQAADNEEKVFYTD